MKVFYYVILGILVFLAISSGVTKIMLMQQDVDFFGQYGFTNPILVIYGVTQLVGGLLLVIPKTRIVGASIVAATFLISLAVLVMSGNVPFAIITAVCIAMLVMIIMRTLKTNNVNDAASE